MTDKQIYWGLVPMSHYQLRIIINPPPEVNHYEDYNIINGTDHYKQAKRFESLQNIANILIE